MKRLIIICAGNFGREVDNVVERINKTSYEPKWDLLGVVDNDNSQEGGL